MSNQPPSQHEALRPVVYELGATIYLCQQFESVMLLLLALFNSQEGMVSADSFRKGVGLYSDRTLGQLAKVFKSKLQLPEAYEDFIRTGVETRNSIVHGFVMRNQERMLSIDGRAEVVEELQKAQHVINERILSLNSLLDRVLKVFGGSMEKLRQDMQFGFEAGGDASFILH